MVIDPELSDGLVGLIERFDHVAVGVRDIAESLPLVRLLGGEFLDGGDSTVGSFRWIQFTLPGQGKIELIQPLPTAGPDNFLRRFLDSRGEGVHHLTIKVHDFDKAIARVTAMGFSLVGLDDSNPKWKEAFVHPMSSSGVVVQIAQWDDLPKDDDVTVEAVLKGIRDRYA